MNRRSSSDTLRSTVEGRRRENASLSPTDVLLDENFADPFALGESNSSLKKKKLDERFCLGVVLQ